MHAFGGGGERQRVTAGRKQAEKGWERRGDRERGLDLDSQLLRF